MWLVSITSASSCFADPDDLPGARKFSGKYPHRLLTGGVGHNLPQEARRPLRNAASEAGPRVGWVLDYFLGSRISNTGLPSMGSGSSRPKSAHAVPNVAMVVTWRPSMMVRSKCSRTDGPATIHGMN
jgi:hypothetical protein